MIVSARNLQEMLILQESCKILARFVFPVDQGNDNKKKFDNDESNDFGAQNLERGANHSDC